MGLARSSRVLVFAVALSGCASTATVQSAGDEGFSLSAHSTDSSAGVLLAQDEALQNARGYCAAQGRRFLALGSQVGQDGFSSDLTYTVRFRCLAVNSPELQRPAVNQAPDNRL